MELCGQQKNMLNKPEYVLLFQICSHLTQFGMRGVLTSAQHLLELLCNCWITIPRDGLVRLTDEVPRVCCAVIKAKGGCSEKSKI